MEDVAASTSIVVVAVLTLAAVVLARAVKVVPRQRIGVVERLGRYHRTIEPGINLMAPFIDRVRTTVDTGEQEVTFGSLSCLSSDRYPVAVKAPLRYQVTDPVAATY